tara:strand:- start:46 stop:591 length:546 start_codon:yes stop_codon:yes gene_type:complete
MGSSHSYLQNLEAQAGKTLMYTLKDGACYQYEVSDLYTNIAMTEGSVAGTCAKNAKMTVQGKTFNHAGEYKGHSYTTVVTEFTASGLQELCSGWQCDKAGDTMQELYASENLTHWVIDGKCYQKAVPANIMAEVLKAPINGLAGGCIVGGYSQKAGSVSANVATFGDVVLDEYTMPGLMMI